MKTFVVKVAGMDCAEEIAVLRREITTLSEVEDVSFDLLRGTMSVTFDEAHLSTDKILAAVSRTGLSAVPYDAKSEDVVAAGGGRSARAMLTAASGLLVVAGFLVHGAVVGWSAAIGGDENRTMPWLSRAFYVAATLAGAWFVLGKAWLAVKRLRPDMNLLMTVAVVGALLIDEFFEAATVAFLFALSLALEAWSVGRARRAIQSLMQLAPDTACVRGENGVETTVPVADVPLGMTLIVRPGEKIPLDGQVVKGETSVNQAPITGESMPVHKAPGSEVFAGTINHDGAIEIIATKLATDSTLAKIIKLVGDAQSKRSPSEQWVESFARYYTPAVMALAIAVMLLPPLLFDGEWTRWFYEGLVLLVIACPCALVISTPVSIVAALTAAAREGVLIKGGPYIEAPARLRAIAFDKTGTLTRGRPEVRKVISLSGHDERELLEIAAAIESRSQHPLAQAIMRAAQSAGITPRPADDFQSLTGKGATARIDGRDFWLGSHRLLEERGQETPEMHAMLEEFAAGGHSVIVVGEEDHVCGLIAVADALRDESPAALAALRAAGIARLVLLTGDNRPTGEAIGKTAGVDEVKAELLPEDKVAAIEELARQHGHVAMVGDGVNDAPAMARATLGIAMGAMGTDAALETADIALMTDDLSKLAWLVRHSRRTLAVIRQNIFASLAVKGAFVILTLAGHASLWAAIAADMGMSLLVIGNALRLLGSEIEFESEGRRPA
ncbi:MAG: cadmium-translocating P-type ATPase [Planctomycetota bacterium]|nr:MAG: cadmium-translocating P-type ATPase [Planctomycetota bacterium]